MMSGEEQSTADLEAEVDDLRERVERLEHLVDDDPERVDDVPTLSTFVTEAEPSTHAERALLIAYYLEQYEGQDTFTTNAIEDGYIEARMKPPVNLSDTLADCGEKGWVLEAGTEDGGQSRLRRLTNDGMQTAEGLINGA